MLRLAARRCVLHPKATRLLQNIIMSPLSKFPWKKEEEEVSEYICTGCVCMCVKVRRDLLVREKEMERGLERGVEGWGGPLIWKVWCEWRTSGSPRWWILLHMQYGKVIPSFFFLRSSPSFCSPQSVTSAFHSINTQLLFSSPRLSLTSLPPSCFPDSLSWLECTELQHNLSARPSPLLRERKSQLWPAHLTHTTHFHPYFGLWYCWLTFHKNLNLSGSSSACSSMCVSAYIKAVNTFHFLSVSYNS